MVLVRGEPQGLNLNYGRDRNLWRGRYLVRFSRGRNDMMRWAVIFLVVGLVMAVLGFGGIGGAFIEIAKILFFVAVAIFVILLVLGLLTGKKVAGR